MFHKSHVEISGFGGMTDVNEDVSLISQMFLNWFMYENENSLIIFNKYLSKVRNCYFLSKYSNI